VAANVFFAAPLLGAVVWAISVGSGDTAVGRDSQNKNTFPQGRVRPNISLTIGTGGQVDEPGRFVGARRIAVDRSGRAYVADRSGRVQVFDSSGVLLRVLHPEGTSDEDIDTRLIHGLAVNQQGELFVSLAFNVMVYSTASGGLLREIRRPSGACFRELSLSPQSELFAFSACSGRDPYQLYKLSDTVELVASGPLHATRMEGVDTNNKLAIMPGGDIYVPHPQEFLLQIFTTAGVPSRQIDGPFALAVDSLRQPRAALQGHSPGALAADESHIFAVSSGEVLVFNLSGLVESVVEPVWVGWPDDIALGPDGALWVVSEASGVYRLTLAAQPSSMGR
jgi:hypothetical protein